MFELQKIPYLPSEKWNTQDKKQIFRHQFLIKKHKQALLPLISNWNKKKLYVDVLFEGKTHSTPFESTILKSQYIWSRWVKIYTKPDTTLLYARSSTSIPTFSRTAWLKTLGTTPLGQYLHRAPNARRQGLKTQIIPCLDQRLFKQPSVIFDKKMTKGLLLRNSWMKLSRQDKICLTECLTFNAFYKDF
jgi:chorismate-pyruvate lyase